MFIYTFIFFLFGFSPQSAHNSSDIAQQAHTITINFKNIKTKKGIVSIGLYKNATEFDNEKPFKTHKIAKSKLVNGSITFKTSLPNGTYAIAALDDTNNNGDMDYNFFGYPLEGFGFSNYYHSGLTAPDFTDFDFKVSQATTVNVKMKYM